MTHVGDQTSSVLTRAPVVIYSRESVNPHRLVFVSDNIRELLGCHADELMQHREPLQDQLHPDDVDRVVQAISAAQPDEVHVLRYRIRKADGAYCLVEDRFRIVSDESKGSSELVGALIDISENSSRPLAASPSETQSEGIAETTEASGPVVLDVENLQQEIDTHRHAERGLWESYQHYRTIADFAPDLVYYRKPDGALDYISPAAKELTGYSAEEFQTTPGLFERLIHPADRDNWESHHREAMGGARTSALEFRIITKSGEIRWISHTCRTVRDGQGTFLGIRASNRDVTDLKETQQRLEASEALLNETQSLASIGGWEYDVTTGLLHWTAQIYRIYEVDDSFDPNVTTAIAFFVPEHIPIIEDAFERALTCGETYDLELEMLTAKGRRICCRAVGKPHIEEGRVIKVSGFFQEITDRKRAEERLAQTMQELERSNSELERFAYLASHDLQEPLRMISSYCQLINRQFSDTLPAQAQEYLGFAVDGASRMTKLVNDLLTYSRIGRKRLETGPVPLETVVSRVASYFEQQPEAGDVTIEYRDLPVVHGDSSALTQVFQNLIGNAIKFRGEEAPQVRIEAKRWGLFWVVRVTDNGIGVDPMFQERIFEMFQRLHTRQEFPGTGIGLAVCRKIVNCLGGRIWVESEPGKGSTFFFTVPATPDQP